ncbi:dihydrofolate reductase [Nocardiopsis sp. CNT-189]|uniref:dihydrofolate reductase family protein n=1 Tax=Nocardiopsis oceanisediminis TaxID=2816862 RepID=UPI003B2BD14C
MASERPFTASVYIATSLDGFIARPGGDLDWLTAHDAGEAGYEEFMARVDTVVMGRATYETLVGFGPEAWPYAGKRVAVLSTRMAEDADERVGVHRDLDGLVADLAARGTERVYADGGQVVQAFLRAGLVEDVTITRVPVLIGTGIPLFGPLEADVELTHVSTRMLGAGCTQSVYTVGR